MKCENCDALVETEFRRHTEWDDRLEYYYGDKDFRGEYDPEKAGEPVTDKDGWIIGVRIDLCANCGAFVDGRTYAVERSGDE